MLPLRLRDAAVCTGWRRPACRTTSPRSRVLEKQRLQARGLGAPAISRSTASGRTTILFALLQRRRARPDGGEGAQHEATGARADDRQRAGVARGVALPRARHASLLSRRAARPRLARSSRSSSSHDQRPHRDHDARRVLRRARRQPAGRDGARRRRHDGPHVGARPTTPGTNPNWVVFALTNPTDKPVERWLTAERYNIIGSGVVWPDLDARRIEAVTPSIGFVPERIKSDRADMFRITLEPGQTVTYVAELASERFARLYLWKPLEYELKSPRPAALQRHHAGHHRPARHLPDRDVRRQPQGDLPERRARRRGACWPTCASTSASCTSCSSCGPRTTRVYRAASEAAMAASLVIFLSRVPAPRVLARLHAHAVRGVDHRAAGARRGGRDRSAPGRDLRAPVVRRHRRRRRRASRCSSPCAARTARCRWSRRGCCSWSGCSAPAMTLTGRLSGDIVVFGPVAGPRADRRADRLHGHPVRLPLARAAVSAPRRASCSCARWPSTAPAAAVWEWNARRDEIKVSPVDRGVARPQRRRAVAPRSTTSSSTCIPPTASASADPVVGAGAHRRRASAPISACATPTTATAGSSWKRRACPTPIARAMRCVGLVRDVTDAKRAQERLLHDAVHDSLTGPAQSRAVPRPAGVAASARQDRERRCGRASSSSTSTSSRASTSRSAWSSATACC